VQLLVGIGTGTGGTGGTTGDGVGVGEGADPPQIPFWHGVPGGQSEALLQPVTHAPPRHILPVAQFASVLHGGGLPTQFWVKVLPEMFMQLFKVGSFGQLIAWKSNICWHTTEEGQFIA
jgi:hypothetical protein